MAIITGSRSNKTTGSYANTIDRLQYVFFLNQKYATAIIDNYGNLYTSDTARLDLSKSVFQTILKKQTMEEMSIMDSYRWHNITLSTTKKENKKYLVLSRILFNPETAGRKGHVLIIMPFEYIENILSRQQGLFQITDENGSILYSTPAADSSFQAMHDQPFQLEPTKWQLNYWKNSDGITAKIQIFRLSTYIAIAIIVILIIGFTAMVIREIRKVMLQIRSLSSQLARNDGLDQVHVKSDYRIIELSQTLKQLVHNLNTARNNVEAAANEKRILEMQVLQQQINPHFLLNTLNTFRWMADSVKQTKLSSLILALSHMLRQQLYYEKSLWTVKEELEYIMKYIEIQKARYGETIAVSIEVDPEIESILIVKMLLQPLVENCFEHAFPGRAEGNIKIHLSAYQTGILIVVADDGVGFGNGTSEQKHRKSIGLGNVKSRLRLHYGNSSSLSMDESIYGGARVTIWISEGGEDL